jgi:hypothetical protein
MAQTFTVIFTDKGGPYTLHTLGKIVFPVSHRGNGIAELYVGTSEQEVINKIVAGRGRVAVHVYDNAISKARSITHFLLSKKYLTAPPLTPISLPLGGFKEKYDKFFENRKREGQISFKLYGG